MTLSWFIWELWTLSLKYNFPGNQGERPAIYRVETLNGKKVNLVEKAKRDFQKWLEATNLWRYCVLTLEKMVLVAYLKTFPFSQKYSIHRKSPLTPLSPRVLIWLCDVKVDYSKYYLPIMKSVYFSGFYNVRTAAQKVRRWFSLTQSTSMWQIDTRSTRTGEYDFNSEVSYWS